MNWTLFFVFAFFLVTIILLYFAFKSAVREESRREEKQENKENGR